MLKQQIYTLTEVEKVNTPLCSYLKVIAVPVLATILQLLL